MQLRLRIVEANERATGKYSSETTSTAIQPYIRAIHHVRYTTFFPRGKESVQKRRVF